LASQCFNEFDDLNESFKSMENILVKSAANLNTQRLAYLEAKKEVKLKSDDIKRLEI
jgi:hypothetical protein